MSEQTPKRQITGLKPRSTEFDVAGLVRGGGRSAAAASGAGRDPIPAIPQPGTSPEPTQPPVADQSTHLKIERSPAPTQRAPEARERKARDRYRRNTCWREAASVLERNWK